LIVGEAVIDAEGDSFYVLGEREVEVVVRVEDADEVDSAVVEAGGEVIVLEEVDGAFVGAIDIGDVGFDLEVVVAFDDGRQVTEDFDIRTSIGLVYVDGEEGVEPLDGVTVIAYVYEGGSWTPWVAIDGQANPVMTSSGGGVGWYVPDGLYRVTAGKVDFDDASVEIRVTHGVLAPRIKMVEQDVVGAVFEAITEALPIAEVIVPEAAVAVVEEIVDDVAQIVEEIREVPEVQVAATVSTPVVVATSVGSAVVLTSSFQLLPFLQYFFTSPILFFARRKRKTFGLVYNSMTKMPVDLAIVRLFNVADGKLVKTMVTDQEGRYFFKVDNGRYRMEVLKQGFRSPSAYVKGRKADGQYLDVYDGGEVEVTDANAVIAANIPVDPAQVEGAVGSRKASLKRFMRVLQYVVSVTGLGLSGFVLFVDPTLVTQLLFGFQVGVLGVTFYLIRPKQKRGWGMVWAGEKKPVKDAVVRLFEPKFNKLIETTLSDKKGRYAFFVGPNEYYVTFEKPGFAKKEVRPIDYTANTEPAPISVDVRLQKGGA